MDGKICKYYNDLHKKQEFSYKKEIQRIRYAYEVNEWVWVLRDPNPGKMETWWVGPCKVIKRVGEYSYQISTHPTRLDSVWDVHWDFVKKHKTDYIAYSETFLHYHHSMGRSSLIEGEYDMVDNILGHQIKKAILYFQIQWKHSSQITWEDCTSFILGCSKTMINYVQEHGLHTKFTNQLVK